MGHLVDGGDALDVLEDGLHAEFGERGRIGTEVGSRRYFTEAFSYAWK